MKFEITANTLAEKLNQLVKIIPTRNKRKHPVFQCVLIECVKQRGKHQQIRLTTTNGEIAITTHLNDLDKINLYEQGSVFVNARQLSNLCRTLGTQPLQFLFKDADSKLTLPKDPTGLVIKCQGDEYQLEHFSSESFLPVEKHNASDILTIPAKETLYSLLQCHKFTADSSIRFNLGVSQLLADENSMRFVTTDGHRLSLIEASLDNQLVVNKKTQLIPSLTMKTLISLLQKDYKHKTINVELELPKSEELDLKSNKGSKKPDDKKSKESNKQNLIVRCGDYLICENTPGYSFPDYKAILFKLESSVTFKRQLFLSKLKSLLLFVNRPHHTISLTFDIGKKEITLETINAYQAKGCVSIPIETSDNAKNLYLNFSGKYIMEFLQTADTEFMEMKFNPDKQDGSCPIEFRPVHTGNYKQIYVLMPMKTPKTEKMQ